MISIKTSKTLIACLSVIGLFSMINPASATVFSIDEFKVTRANGNSVFLDTFSDGNAPPSAPNFSNGNAGSYFTTGTFGPESGGKLALDTSLGAVRDAVGRPGQNLVLDARLQSNVDQTNTTNGLKAANDFIVSGLFDLSTLPGNLREGFGIRLSDGGISADVNDNVELLVRRNVANELVVSFRRVDIVADLITTIDSILFELGHQQVLLELSKLNAATKTITASFAYVDGDIIGARTVFANTTDIFNGETATRASFRATTPIPLPPTAFLALLGLAAMVFVRKRNA